MRWNLWRGDLPRCFVGFCGRVWVGVGLLAFLGQGERASWGAEKGSVQGDPAPYQIPSLRVPERLRRGFGKAKYALIVSLDGVSAEDVELYGKDAPVLRGLSKRGVRCAMETVFPSVTWASHASMTTGQYPSHHGVLGNRWLEGFFDLIFPYQESITELDRLKRTPSLYDIAYRKGWPTAALNWPGTQKARTLTYNLPAIMYDASLWFRYTSLSIRALLRKMYRAATKRDSIRSDRHMEMLFGRIMDGERMEADLMMTEMAERLVAGQGQIGRLKGKSTIPRVFYLHYVLPDVLNHKYGRNGWTSRWALQLNDQLLGRVLAAYRKAGILQKTAIFVVSDHGFLNVHHAIDPRLLLIKEGFSKYRNLGRRHRRRERTMVFQNGHAAYVYIRPSYRDRYRDGIIKAFKKPAYAQCVESVYTPDAFARLGLPKPLTGEVDKDDPYAWHRGAPDLVVLTKPNCYFRRGHRRKILMKVASRPKAYFYGSHGYLPNHPKMLATWIASGAGIKRNGRKIGTCRVVDIAPTMAHLLGLRWPKTWAVGKKKKPFTMAGRIQRSMLAR
ncbi:MAG: alkaline phosphatase family protein [Myxococcales bacterium]|nr:alkaline phosphatase family protein [Myxococcales bacterium]